MEKSSTDIEKQLNQHKLEEQEAIDPAMKAWHERCITRLYAELQHAQMREWNL